MGKLESSILGKIKGKVGNLVFYELAGQMIVRKRPSPGKRKLSDLQKYHQVVFKVASSFIKPFKEELNFTMSAFEKGGKKGMHHGLGYLIKNSILHGDHPSVLPESIQISEGTLTGNNTLNAERLSLHQIRISWEDNSWEGSAREGDIAYVLIYDPKNNRVHGLRSGNYRKHGFQIVDIPWAIHLADQVWVYFSFYSCKNKPFTFSNSVCLGQI